MAIYTNSTEAVDGVQIDINTNENMEEWEELDAVKLITYIAPYQFGGGGGGGGSGSVGGASVPTAPAGPVNPPRMDTYTRNDNGESVQRTFNMAGNLIADRTTQPGSRAGGDNDSRYFRSRRCLWFRS